MISGLWGLMTETGAREVNSGMVAGIVGVVAGLPSMTWAAMQGDWLPAYAGSATGIGCAIYSIWQQGENRRIRLQAEAMTAMAVEISGLRIELKAARQAAEDADIVSIEERRKLRMQIEELTIHNTRLTAGVRRVENIVANPANPPDPDATRGGI